MKPTTAILATLLLSAAAVPAFAAWDRIGSLDVSGGKTQSFDMTNFKGNVIGLTARESDVTCERVMATFADGDMRPIFKGKLPKGLSVRVDLPPGAVQRLELDCHPMKGSQATVDLAADNGTTNQHG